MLAVTEGEITCGPNVAITSLLPLRFTTQEPVPKQSPVQPIKAEPSSGFAVRVTLLPLANLALQVGPQSIPAGVLVTNPAPDLATFRVKVLGIWLFTKVALALLAESMATTHGPMPLQAPLQPLNL